MKRSLRVLFAAVAVLAALCAGAWADPPTQVTSDTKEWKEANSPYYVDGTVTISDRITVTGTVELELRDGFTLTAEKGIEVNSGNKLTINGGPANTGKLIATGPSSPNGAAIGSTAGTAGTIIINGGTVEATSQNAASAARAASWPQRTRRTTSTSSSAATAAARTAPSTSTSRASTTRPCHTRRSR